MTNTIAVASRDDNATTRPGAQRACPVCAATFRPIRRQLYCSTACRKTAFRRRHTTVSVPAIPARQGRRTVTVYECPNCADRQIGEQRCAECNTFGQALGLAGTCPNCDGIIAAADLDTTH